MTPVDKEKHGRTTIKTAQKNGMTRTEIRLSPKGRQAVQTCLCALCSNLILFFSGKGLYAVGDFAKGENVTVFAGKVGPASSAQEAFRYPPPLLL